MVMDSNILQSIGNTSLVQLHNIVPSDCAKILVKLEWQNPTGSMKDRMALGMISLAEEEGKLSKGYTVVEYTGGSTGASLGLVCAAKGYPLHVVSSDAFSRDKLDHMVAYGVSLTLIPSEGGRFTKQLFLDMIETARKLSLNSHTYWTNQLNNKNGIAGYFPLGEEILKQTNGEIDAFVQTVGTAHSLRGVATVLKRYNPKIKIIAWEPGESPVLSGGQPGSHHIEGIGIGFTPPLWDPNIVDEILTVNTSEAKDMARQLARKEGMFAGTSSGGNVQAAIRIAKKLGPNAKVVTLMIDSGLKYVSTDLYRNDSSACIKSSS